MFFIFFIIILKFYRKDIIPAAGACRGARGRYLIFAKYLW